MKKTLTEQWKDGELEDGYYYVNGKWINYYSKDDGYFDDGGIEEVLAPVPSYEEYEDILQQNVNQESAIETYIEEIKRLQEQIKEADEVIKAIKKITGKIDLSQFDYEHRRKIDGITMETDSYLEKCGVK